MNTAAAAQLWGAEGQGWAGDASGPLQAQPQQQQLSPSLAHSLPAQHQQGEPALHAAGGPHHTAAAKVYVQGLPQSLQHPVAVASLFTPFGDVLDVKLYAAEVRLSGGSAVVRMRSTVQAASAIAALNGAVPEGGWQQLTVRSAETAEQRSSRITAINGRQQGGGPLLGPAGPDSPTELADPRASGGGTSGPPLPPSGPGGVVLCRIHSSHGGGGPGTAAGALQSFTAGLTASDLRQLPPAQRRSLDGWGGSAVSMTSFDSSRRSSMDVVGMGMHRNNARCSSDSGSGGGGSVDELQLLAAGGGSGGAAGGLADAGGPLSTPDMQRMLLEAVLALVGQVESGQLSMGSMRIALESALVAAKHTGRVQGDSPLLYQQGGGGMHGTATTHTSSNNNHNNRMSFPGFRS